MSEPARSYIICTTPRSGSTLLCDLLTGTRSAGRPNSFFMHEFYPEWAEDFGVSVEHWPAENAFDRAYLEAALREGRNDTPVFGMRLMWESLADLQTRLGSLYPDLDSDRARFDQAFDSPRYLHLVRGDRVAQAISLLRAEQSGLWHVHADGSERERLAPAAVPRYDAEEIRRLETSLANQDASWTRWFDSQGIQPIPVSYEKLSSDPGTVLAATLQALGLDPDLARSVRPATARLSGKQSREWADRYRADSKQA